MTSGQAALEDVHLESFGKRISLQSIEKESIFLSAFEIFDQLVLSCLVIILLTKHHGYNHY